MARSFEHKVLAGAVGPNDGLDEVLRRVLIVDKQLLGGLGKAHPGAVGGVVIAAADARLQAHAVDEVGRAQSPHLAVGVQLVKVGHAEG